MTAIAQFINHGGCFSYLVIAATLCAVVPWGIVHAAAARKWSMIVALCFLLVPLALGIIGYVEQASRVKAALPGADPRHREEMLALGLKEARSPFYLGATGTGLGFVLVVVGEIRRLRRQNRALLGR